MADCVVSWGEIEADRKASIERVAINGPSQADTVASALK